MASVLHLGVGGRQGQPVIGQRGGEAGGNGRAGDAVGVDVLAVATQGALVLQGALGSVHRRLSRVRLCRVALAALLCVGAEVRGVQAVSCGENKSSDESDRWGVGRVKVCFKGKSLLMSVCFYCIQ